jgi:hypothetical protein
LLAELVELERQLDPCAARPMWWPTPIRAASYLMQVKADRSVGPIAMACPPDAVSFAAYPSRDQECEWDKSLDGNSHKIFSTN